MRTLARILRLLSYFERKKEEKALELSKTQKKIRDEEGILLSILHRLAQANQALAAYQDGVLDLEQIKQSGAFKFFLDQLLSLPHGYLFIYVYFSRGQKGAIVLPDVFFDRGINRNLPSAQSLPHLYDVIFLYVQALG